MLQQFLGSRSLIAKYTESLSTQKSRCPSEANSIQIAFVAYENLLHRSGSVP